MWSAQSKYSLAQYRKLGPMIAIRPPGCIARAACQHVRDRVLVGQVLEEVRKEHAVEVLPGRSASMMSQVIIFTPADRGHALSDPVDSPALVGGHRGDELAAARGRIEHALGPPIRPWM